MEWTNAKIEKAFMGIEDHGIFAWGLSFSSGSLHQSTGLRWVAPDSLPILEAIVTHFGPWNDLEGKLVRIGKVTRTGPITAMRDILDDAENKIVRFEAH